MSLLRPLDPAFPIERQIAIDAGPVVLVNVFTLDKADEHTFLKAWIDDAVFMKKLLGYLQQWTGYCLTGDMREQCFPFFYGEGNNGKTVFLQLLRSLLKDYGATATIELFVTTGIGKHLTEFAALHRKRCVITNETQKGHKLRMDVIKNITGQDPIRANFMRQDTFEFLPVCKLNMFGNHKPDLPNVGKAEQKRVRMVHCELNLAGPEIDKGLPDCVRGETGGYSRGWQGLEMAKDEAGFFLK
jgi:putative DNA primase/helicase